MSGPWKALRSLQFNSQHPFDVVGSRRTSLLGDPYRHDSRRTSPVYRRLEPEPRGRPDIGFAAPGIVLQRRPEQTFAKRLLQGRFDRLGLWRLFDKAELLLPTINTENGDVVPPEAIRDTAGERPSQPPIVAGFRELFLQGAHPLPAPAQQVRFGNQQ